MDFQNILDGAATAVLLIIMLLVGIVVFWVQCRIHGIDLSKEIRINNNAALGIRFALYFLALVIVFIQTIYHTGSFGDNAEVIFKYTLPAIAMMVVAYYVNDKLILYSFDNNREVVGEKNIAVAFVEGATYLATAFILSSTLVGLEDDLAEAILWLVIGQVLLIVLSLVYGRLIPNVFKALDEHNFACAISLGSLLFSAGLVLSAAISGPSSTWGEDLAHTGLFLAGWGVMILVAHVFADRVVIPGVHIRNEVMEETNVAAGALEGALFLCFTLIYIIVN